MQAYRVYCKDDWIPWSEIVFADRRSKAIVTALHYSDSFGDGSFDYTDLRAVRRPELDKYYRGVSIMDWYNPDDRLAMIKDGGFQCADDSFDPDDCERCVGKDYCDRYDDYLEEKEEYEEEC